MATVITLIGIVSKNGRVAMNIAMNEEQENREIVISL